MTHDPTENTRRRMAADVNSKPRSRDDLERAYGKGNVWSTDDLRAEFEVQSFGAPFCLVKRRSDGVRGSLMFQHHPRFYFDFNEDTH